jgi:hypothetical protein
MHPNPPTPVSGPFIATRRPLSRRHFLRGTGVALALPWLEAMLPVFGRAQEPARVDAKPRRMFAVINNLGFIPDYFFPTGGGRDYVASPYLELLQAHRPDFTVFTGVSLPGVDGGYASDVAWLTGAPHPGRGGFRNTVSLDQVVARHLGHLTRFPSLTLAVNTRSRGLSVSETGKLIPPVDQASQVFRQLFIAGSPAENAAQLRELETGRSILDTVAGQAQVLDRAASVADRERLDQYYTSVRELETRLKATHDWLQRPKPTVDATMPVDPPSPAMYFEKLKLMYDMAVLAFQTDSTRAITLFIDSVATPPVAGTFPVPITEAYLRLAYHDYIPSRVAQFDALSREHFRRLDALLASLKSIDEAGESLLDRTQVLWGSNFNEANGHKPRFPIPTVDLAPAANPTPPANPSNEVIRLAPFTRRHNEGVTTNLPIVFAGGGWKHGQHLVFDREKNYPLTNLHLSMLHRMGIPEQKFSSSTGPFAGMEMA